MNNKRLLFGLLLAITALSGFVHLPMAKRYSLVKIPGLSWTGDYFTSHYVHYISATFLLLWLAYRAVFFIFEKNESLTVSGILRVVILSVLALSGFFHVISNMGGVNFSATFITTIDFTHLGFAFLLLFVYVPLSIIRRPFIK